MDFFQNEEIPGAHKKYFKGSFYENFTRRADVEGKSVQVIWYELRDNDASSAAELFKRLNDKSIKLNNAELIRALFLSESAHYEPETELPKGRKTSTTGRLRSSSSTAHILRTGTLPGQ